MSVPREQAAVGEALELRLLVRNRLGALTDATVGPVSVYDDETGDLLEAFATPTRLQRGVYSVTTDPAWNTAPRRARDEWAVTPKGASDPTVISKTFQIRDPGECPAPQHVDDGVPVLVGSTVQEVGTGLYELRVTEDHLHRHVPAGVPVSCLGDRLLDARQRAERCCHRRPCGCGEGSFDSAGDPTLEIHPHTPWWIALVRIFDLVPSTRVGRMWLHDRICAEIDGRPAVVLVFRHTACDPS